MQITLKQKEIKAALHMYLAAIGVALAGKAVEITFTAGRKEAGLSADVSIEEGGTTPEAAATLEVPAATTTTVTPITPVPTHDAGFLPVTGAAANEAPADPVPTVTEDRKPASLFG